METTRQVDNLTWADLTIIEDVLKAVWEFDVKSLKHRDLWTVCSQLNIKGVKSSTKEQMIKKLVSLHQFKVSTTKFQRCLILQWQESSRSAPTDCWTSSFQTHFLKALLNLGMWLHTQSLMREKPPTISYSGNMSKKPLKDKTKLTFCRWWGF